MTSKDFNWAIEKVKPWDLYYNISYTNEPDYSDGSYDGDYKGSIYNDNSDEDCDGEVTVLSVDDHGFDQRLDFSNDVVDGRFSNE